MSHPVEGLTIREGMASDAAALLLYLEDVSGESDNLTFGPGDFKMSIEEEANFLESQKAAINCVYFLAFDGDKIVGTLNVSASTRPRISHVGELGLCVRKEYWHRGVGSSLMAAMAKWAKGADSGIRKINLLVREDNLHAIQLYEKFGFVQEGQNTRMQHVGSHFIDGLYMGLCID